MKQFQTESEIYEPKDIDIMLNNALDESMTIKSNKKIVYYNLPASYDIETTSFNRQSSQLESEKVAIMYEWTLGINGQVMIGRSWYDFMNVMDKISSQLDLYPNKKHLIIYVHNLAFEFQFICKRFKWHKIFAIDQRKPIYAITDTGIEFRDSYLLSGYALAKLGEELRSYPVAKMVGDLDYSLLRHELTHMTEKELKYCENDVRVVMSYIQERIEIDGNILKIPLTKTGYVRKFCRDACLYEGSHKHNTAKFHNYRKLMNSLTLTPDEYKQAKRAFQGGFTHANAIYSSRLEENVASFDFTSSYPYVMLSEKFPMSRGIIVQLKSPEDFERYLKLYCCMFDIRFTNIRAKTLIENPISISRCPILHKPVINNGRLVKADDCAMTLTEQDYLVYREFYEWDKIEVHNFRVYYKQYLPTDFVKSILKLYSDKTTLKGIQGREVEYLMGKSMLNACYGMAVTDICRDENIFDGAEWKKDKPTLEDEILKYNKSKRRFLFYPWGVWVTAYARRNLFTGIKEFGMDYIYSDTDSIKAKNYENHMDYINKYNNIVKLKLETAMKFHGIDFEQVEPKTIKGDKKLIGVWDFEGVYDKFKTLGAKRYMVEESGKISMTVSGVNKVKALPYLVDNFGDKIFDNFDDDLKVPAPYSGKMTHTYIDTEKRGVLVDWKGIECEYCELSAVHLENADYKMSLADNYIEYLKGVQQHED